MTVLNPSKAHQRSAFAVEDPAYSIFQLKPPRRTEKSWLYPRAEYECFLLNQMRKAVERLKLNVRHPGEFHRPVSRVLFRRELAAGVHPIRVNGSLSVIPNGEEIVIEPKEEERDCFLVHLKTDGILTLQVEVNSTESMLPSIQPEELSGWTASTDGERFEEARPGGDPFGETIPSIRLIPTEYAPGRYDAGREILAKVRIISKQKPEFGAGESQFEMENTDPGICEQTLELAELRSGVWETPDPLAFRYLRVEAETPVRVECDAEFTPARYAGAFASDPELTRIWMDSAYTLRLCMRHFLIDGIKRDRLPWAGDLALSLLADAYTFADPEPVRRTLTVLSRAGIRNTHVNGATDYSLWILISHDLFQRYFSDLPFLRRQYSEIREMAEILLEQASGGFLPPGDWVFIDWVHSRREPEREWNKAEKQTVLQILFFQAMKASAALAERMGDAPFVRRCLDKATELRERLLSRAFDPERGLFRANMENPEDGFYRHANYCAVLSGLVEGDEAKRIMQNLCLSDLPPVGTPYQAALEILAMIRTGLHENALASIRRIWGGMLRKGATTFFEAWDETAADNAIYSFYGRPCGLSLCHAWSSGPAALLPILFFGCEPLEDGWRTVRFHPSPLLADEDSATIPTPLGEIRFSRTEGKLEQEVPPGIVLSPDC